MSRTRNRSLLLTLSLALLAACSQTPSPRTAPAADAGLSTQAVLPGKITAWGNDYYGQVSNTPTDSGYVAVAAGGVHSLALKGDGTLRAWGFNGEGQVSNTPTDSGYVAVAGGRLHNLALRGDSTLKAWGNDDDGQVRDTPTDAGYVAIAAGAYHNLALKEDGTLRAWGDDGDSQVSSTPTDSGYIAIAASRDYNLAIKSSLSDRYLIDFETAPTDRLIYSVKLNSGVMYEEGDDPKDATVPVVGKRRSNGSIVQQHTARVVRLYGSDRLVIANPNNNIPAPTGGRIKLSFTNFDPEGVTLTSLTLSNLTAKNPYLTFYYVDGTSSRQNLGTTAKGGSVVVPLNVRNLRAVDIYAANAYAVDDVRFTDEADD